MQTQATHSYRDQFICHNSYREIINFELPRDISFSRPILGCHDATQTNLQIIL